MTRTTTVERPDLKGKRPGPPRPEGAQGQPVRGRPDPALGCVLGL